ncbi:glutamate racemase [Ignatzschineria ureiclastica]|uniref:Glutamate racemase n=1 Tax=Ignatzschineria ureiclastica TaxID=472582 RepID=A0A2U2ADW4_9GAMM|nr:glutamate racemase [Ignatzschineria ureiclastica]PWD80841.1 glutamate racemase [Ignatzschineria ureiclastica]GGZ94405.1 glutamate racemase [Ignatzschineria ureiclastica]
MQQNLPCNLKIGLIDSGVGGFSILNSFLHRSLPGNSHYYYIADSGHLPYGLKSDRYIYQRMLALTQYLLTLKIDVLVIACNTATAVSVDLLRTRYPELPIIGVEPAIKPAAEMTKTMHIAVAATESTLKSQRLSNLVNRYASHCTLHPITGTKWVDLVESGEYLDSSVVDKILAKSLEVVWDYPVDQLILGCTHFPFLTEAIIRHIPERVSLINPARSIVAQCDQRLSEIGKLASLDSNNQTEGIEPQVHLTLMTTGNMDNFKQQVSTLVSPHYHQLRLQRIDC